VKRRAIAGFTLVELVIVVLIIAVLASLAVPAYQRYAQRTRRADAREMLMRIAAAQERFYTNYNRYAAAVTGAPPAGLGFASAASEKGYYTVVITAAGAAPQTYSLAAAPVAGQGQQNDKCGTISITNGGVKSFSGNENNGKCW
jgi:type IV pilus assembly protein PilE